MNKTKQSEQYVHISDCWRTRPSTQEDANCVFSPSVLTWQCTKKSRDTGSLVRVVLGLRHIWHVTYSTMYFRRRDSMYFGTYFPVEAAAVAKEHRASEQRERHARREYLSRSSMRKFPVVHIARSAQSGPGATSHAWPAGGVTWLPTSA